MVNKSTKKRAVSTTPNVGSAFKVEFLKNVGFGASDAERLDAVVEKLDFIVEATANGFLARKEGSSTEYVLGWERIMSMSRTQLREVGATVGQNFEEVFDHAIEDVMGSSSVKLADLCLPNGEKDVSLIQVPSLFGMLFTYIGAALKSSTEEHIRLSTVQKDAVKAWRKETIDADTFGSLQAATIASFATKICRGYYGQVASIMGVSLTDAQDQFLKAQAPGSTDIIKAIEEVMAGFNEKVIDFLIGHTPDLKEE